LRHRILAYLLTLSATAAAPAAVSQTAPDYAAIVAAPDRSDADRKLDTNRAPAQWLAFIGAKPGMKILDIFAVYGWKAELLARTVAPDGKVYAQNSEAAFARVKDGSMRGLRPRQPPIPSRWCGHSRILRHRVRITSIS
jgi:predicted methyltransferase